MFGRVLNLLFEPLVIFAKRFILNIWQGSEYASAIYTTKSIIDVYQLEVFNTFHYLSNNIVHVQITWP